MVSIENIFIFLFTRRRALRAGRGAGLPSGCEFRVQGFRALVFWCKGFEKPKTLTKRGCWTWTSLRRWWCTSTSAAGRGPSWSSCRVRKGAPASPPVPPSPPPRSSPASPMRAGGRARLPAGWMGGGERGGGGGLPSPGGPLPPQDSAGQRGQLRPSYPSRPSHPYPLCMRPGMGEITSLKSALPRPPSRVPLLSLPCFTSFAPVAHTIHPTFTRAQAWGRSLRCTSA